MKWAITGVAQPQEEEEADKTDLEPHYIDLVMTQARISKSKDVKALKTHNRT
ncbi:nascent polypeptide-associated complex subunit alpha-like, partial [Trifolium medium]|nr:nascent polypeptide-associated complex subunit alpha-like [Trifolium medium]